MSFLRLVFYHGLFGGWAAFVGWLLAELFFMQRSANPALWPMLWTSALVGAFISGGLSQVPGLLHFNWAAQLKRLGLGLLGGLLGGLAGAWLGDLIFGFLPAGVVLLGQAIGWLFIGLAVGSVEGVSTLSSRQLRNGLLGGAVGGFLAGLLYRPIFWLIGGAMSSRAVGFVLLGLCIGLFIGLAQVVFKEAWLTVLAGFRPGRQMLLGQPEILLGTSEKVHLQFAAAGAKGVEPIHAKITRQKDGSYLLQDNNSRTGTFVNGMPVRAILLGNNDVIQIGGNQVRFGEQLRRSHGSPAPDLPVPLSSQPAASATLAQMLQPGPPPAAPQYARPAQAVPVAQVPHPHLSSSVTPPLPNTAVQAAPRPAVPAPPQARPSGPTLPVARPAMPPAAAPTRPPVAAPARPPAPLARPAAPAEAINPTFDSSAKQGPQAKPAAPRAPVKSACPVCGHVQQGIAGERRCENCETRF